MINPAFAGDTRSVEATAQLLDKDFLRFNDADSNAVQALEANLDMQSGNNALLLSGTHGLAFLRRALTSAKVKQAIVDKSLVISFSAHQAPNNLTEFADNLNVVAILQDYITLQPKIAEAFGARLLPLQMVPNSLKEERLKNNGAEIIAAWNSAHKDDPNQLLPIKPSAEFAGTIGVILGGDAPDLNGKHKAYTKFEAFKDGYNIAKEAMKKNKLLLITNCPRTGQIYSEAFACNRAAALRRFTKDEHGKAIWVDYQALSHLERNDPNNNPPDAKFKAHAAGAPLDPVSAGFLRGMLYAGISADQFRFIDFTFGDSAYEAIASALYADKDRAECFYTGESISNVELATFFDTYVFRIGSMSELHEAFLQRMHTNLQRVGIITLKDNLITREDIDKSVKTANMHITPGSDTQMLANKVADTLKLFQATRAAGAGRPITPMLQAAAANNTTTDAVFTQDTIGAAPQAPANSTEANSFKP